MTARVLVATSTYPRWPGDSHPGFVHELCARLVSRHDVEVTVVAPTSHGAQRDEVVDGVRVIRFAYWRDRPNLLRDGPALPTLKAHPTTALQVPTYLAAMWWTLRAQLRSGRWDAIHAHWLAPQATLARLARGAAGPRLVGTSHGSDVFGLGRLGEPLLRWTLRRLDAFTGVSDAVVQRARSLGLPPSVPATVAPMGIDTDRFRPDPGGRQRVRARLGLGDEPLVLAISRLVPGKGVDVLLDALPPVVRAHPTLRVAVVGHGQARAELEAQRDRLGLGDVVTFHGHQPLAELPGWYAAADVHVSTSRSEGFGLVTAEALACGCPVVATDLPAVREIVTGAAGQLVPVDRPDQLASALSDHLAARDDRRRAALDGAAAIADRFGWDRAADRYAQVLLA